MSRIHEDYPQPTRIPEEPELFHGVEVLDTGKSLRQRFLEGEKGISKNATGWESEAAQQAEATIRVETSQRPPSAAGDLEQLGAFFGVTVYIDGVQMPELITRY